MRYLIATLVLLLSTSTVHAYELSRTKAGVATRWNKDVVRVEVQDGVFDNLGPYVLDTLDEAAKVWALEVPDAPVIEFVPQGVEAEVYIAWVTDWQHKDDELAVTTTKYSDDIGRIRKGFIEINAKVVWNAGTESPTKRDIDLLSVMTHEFGHLLGLDHSKVKGTVMWPEIGKGEIHRRLTQDDIEGMTKLYPPSTDAANYNLELSRGCSLCPIRGTSQFPLLSFLVVASAFFARRYGSKRQLVKK